jgi:hypothetical protein
MPSRTASCSCGQLRIQVEGEPQGVGLCHCLACQQRTGSVFAALASFSAPFKVFGTEYIRTGGQGAGSDFAFARFVGLLSSIPKKVTTILWVSQLVRLLTPPSQRLKFPSMTAVGIRGFSYHQARRRSTKIPLEH